MKDFFLSVLTYEQWVSLFKSLLIACCGIATAILTRAATDGDLGPYGDIIVTAAGAWIANLVKTIMTVAPLPAAVESKVQQIVASGFDVKAAIPSVSPTHDYPCPDKAAEKPIV